MRTSGALAAGRAASPVAGGHARTARLLALQVLPLLVGAALIVGWAVYLRPASLGGPASYVIVAGRSMEPTLRLQDLALVRRQDAYHVGDVIAFRVPEGEVIHRIIGGDPTQGFITQGDNNPQPDLWRPRPAQIEGAMWARVPAGGRVIAFLRQPVNAAIAAEHRRAVLPAAHGSEAALQRGRRRRRARVRPPRRRAAPVAGRPG